eukprot:gene3660-4207_t
MANSTHHASESDFISTLITAKPVWLGAQRSLADKWLWTWVPTWGSEPKVFYDTRQDHCLLFCSPFDASPLVTNLIFQSDKSWVAAISTDEKYYIIEVEPNALPRVSKVNDYDGIITISNLLNDFLPLSIDIQHFESAPTHTSGPVSPGPALLSAVTTGGVTCKLASIPDSTAGLFNVNLHYKNSKNYTYTFTFANPHIMGIKQIPGKVELIGTNLDLLFSPAPYTSNIVASVTVGTSPIDLSGCTNITTIHMNPTIVQCNILSAITIILSKVTITYTGSGIVNVYQSRVPVFDSTDGLYYSYSGFALTLNEAMAYSQASTLDNEIGYVAYIKSSSLISTIKQNVYSGSLVLWSGVQYNQDTGDLEYHNTSASSESSNFGTFSKGTFYYQTLTDPSQPTIGSTSNPSATYAWVIVYGALDPIVDTSRIQMQSTDSYSALIVPLAANFGLMLDSTLTYTLPDPNKCDNPIFTLDRVNRILTLQCVGYMFNETFPSNFHISFTTISTTPTTRTLIYSPSMLPPNVTSVTGRFDPGNAAAALIGTNFCDEGMQLYVNGITLGQRRAYFTGTTMINFYPPPDVGTQMAYVTSPYGKSPLFTVKYKDPLIQTISIDPGTKIVTITGDFLGHNCSQVIINNLDRLPITPTTCLYTSLTLDTSTLSSSVSLRSGSINVTAGGSTSNSATVTFATTLTSVTSPPVTGGMVTLYGSFLSAYSYMNELLVDMTYDGKSISQLIDVPGGIAFTVPPGSGKSHYVVVNGNTDLTKDVYYQAPHIIAVSSTYFKTEGPVTISGSNFALTGLLVTIGGLQCTNPILVDSTKVICTFASNISTDTSLNVTIQVDGQQYSSYSFIYYRVAKKTCTNDCSASKQQGECVNGECQCLPIWNGALDCSVKVVTPDTNNPKEPTIHVAPPVITDTAPKATIGSNTQEGDKPVEFDIAVTHIRETSANGAIEYLTLAITDIVWHNLTSDSANASSSSINSYRGSFPSYPGCIVSVNVTVFLEDSMVNFAGDSFPVLANSVKYQIQVSNWTFNSPLNLLEVIFLTKTDSIAATSDCERQVSVTSDDNSESLRYFQLTKGGTAMRGRFSDRLIADGRVGKSTVKRLNSDDRIAKQYNQSSPNSINVLTSIVAPYFADNLIIDPSFASLLVIPDTTTPDGCSPSSSSSSNWKLPVIIVGSVVGASIIVLAVVLTIKKLGYRTKLITLKLKTMGRSSKPRH